jgi:phosphoglucomutase
MNDLRQRIRVAGRAGQLLESTVRNLDAWCEGDSLPEWARASIAELVDAGAWDELNDRFFQTIAFGTGGMRNRTIGAIVTAAERGAAGPAATPTHAAVGSALLNDFNVIRATIGLYRYCDRHLRGIHGRREIPRLVIAHDMRHFSRHFCELTASTWCRLGGYAMIFDGPRATPQLSYAVRATAATTGIVITASHNPAHDNGFKVYFDDGAQVVYPHAEGIIHEVNQVKLAETARFMAIDLDPVVTLPEQIDSSYLAAVRACLIDPDALAKTDLKVVFSPIHGVGALSAVPALRAAGVEVLTVDAQMVQDPRFPTVKSPNPENAEALSLALALADSTGADLVMATDPDADRLGVAVRDADGKMVLLTGNVIGSLLAACRIERMKELGWLPRAGTRRAALIKTFVTTPLQAAIAEQNGIKCIDTLTGFKWIGEKLRNYQEEMERALRAHEGIAIDFNATSAVRRRELLLRYSTWCVFAGEESYGYLAGDLVRDKDACAAVLMFAELAAWLKGQGRTVTDYLDEVYLRYGYHCEDVINIYYEGASGAAKIARILDVYRSDRPRQIGDCAVTGFRDFGMEDFEDADGKAIPRQDFYFVELDNGYSYAVRGSGTEPKIKFYLFACEDVAQPGDLPKAREQAARTLSGLRAAIEQDARARAGAEG